MSVKKKRRQMVLKSVCNDNGKCLTCLRFPPLCTQKKEGKGGSGEERATQSSSGSLHYVIRNIRFFPSKIIHKEKGWKYVIVS